VEGTTETSGGAKAWRVVRATTDFSACGRARFGRVGRVHKVVPFLSPQPLISGQNDFSIVNGLWTALPWMVEHLVLDWEVFLTEQDYPIVPLEQIEERLSSSGVDAFLEAVPTQLITGPEARKDRDLAVLRDVSLLVRHPADGAVAPSREVHGRIRRYP
jgi:hypothetical protein